MTNIRHPVPVNQFYRLDYDEVQRVYYKGSRWNHTHSGRNFDSVLCMAAAGAVALDAHTAGRVRVNAGQIHDHQTDMSGGIGVDDVKRSWSAGWLQYLATPSTFGWDDIMHAVTVERRNVIIGVDYGKVPYDYQVQKGGTFQHAINLDDHQSDGRVYRFDSLDTRAIWTPQSAYRAAAESLALRERGTRGAIFCALSGVRPLLAAPNTWNVSIHPRSGSKGYPTYRYFGVYSVSNGVITSVAVRRTGGFSATAVDRAFYPYAGHTRQELVRLTSGYLSGKFVRAAYIVEG